MNPFVEDLLRIALVGAGATATMDLWALAQKRMNAPAPNFALVGRWLGHLARGRWSHDAIAAAPPVRGELALGWLFHYAVGMAFAAALVAWRGSGWLHEPSWWPAISVGVVTVLAPWLVMQPAMGAGVASLKTRTPMKNCLRSLGNHMVFGAGLYVAALAVAWSLR